MQYFVTGATGFIGKRLVKKLLDTARRRQVYARWKAQRPRRFDRHLVVIGAGGSGLAAAIDQLELQLLTFGQAFKTGAFNHSAISPFICIKARF